MSNEFKFRKSGFCVVYGPSYLRTGGVCGHTQDPMDAGIWPTAQKAEQAAIMAAQLDRANNLRIEANGGTANPELPYTVRKISIGITIK